MYYYQDAYNELEKDFREKVELLRKHQNLFPIANEYAEKYSSNHESDLGKRDATVHFVADIGTIQCLGLHFVLGEDDYVEEAVEVVEEMMKDRRLETIKPLNREIDSKYEPVEAAFSDGEGRLLVRIHLYQSKSCKEVGTGRWKEIKKVVCEGR